MNTARKKQSSDYRRLQQSDALHRGNHTSLIPSPRPSPWRIEPECAQSTQAVSDYSVPPAASILPATLPEYRAQAAAASELDQAETEHPARLQDLAMNSSGVTAVRGGLQQAL